VSVALRQLGAMKINGAVAPFCPLLTSAKNSAMTPASDLHVEQTNLEFAGAPPQSCTCFSASAASTIATRSPWDSALRDLRSAGVYNSQSQFRAPQTPGAQTAS
jgi:hypothetical protein